MEEQRRNQRLSVHVTHGLTRAGGVPRVPGAKSRGHIPA